MANTDDIYENDATTYDDLVRHEDSNGRLLPALKQAISETTSTPLHNATAIELGAGTGRVTKLLAPHVERVHAFDIAIPMLRVAKDALADHAARCTFTAADNAHLPLAPATADIAIAGWSYGHQTVWHPTAWRGPIAAAVDGMLRVLRPGGVAIIIETLGTGHTTPFEPPAELSRYYAMLSDDYGFASTWIRTDYRFPSLDEGVRLVRAFFGEERAEALEASGSPTLPECTGIWWRRA